MIFGQMITVDYATAVISFCQVITIEMIIIKIVEMTVSD